MVTSGEVGSGRVVRLWLAATALLAMTACARVGADDRGGAARIARQWPAGDSLFRSDPRWLGGDAALSIPLDEARTLWLLGDSFIAPGERSRLAATMVRNSVAIQHGRDPRTAGMSFYWRDVDAVVPSSFFPEHGEQWYWPGHGVRLREGPLLIFLYAMAATPGRDLGFATAGYAVAVIENPDAPPDQWHPRIFEAPAAGFDAVPATAVVQDGAYVVAVAIRQQGTHAGALVRFPALDLAAGRLDGAEWWAGEARGWLAESALGPDGPSYVLDDAGAECSVHYDKRSGQFIHVASYGFGATTIGVRTAPALTGPWTAPRMVFRPAESDDARIFVYAAKGHPHLVGPEPGTLLLTYATNSWEFSDLLTQRGERQVYWPRFVALHLP